MVTKHLICDGRLLLCHHGNTVDGGVNYAAITITLAAPPALLLHIDKLSNGLICRNRVRLGVIDGLIYVHVGSLSVRKRGNRNNGKLAILLVLCINHVKLSVLLDGIRICPLLGKTKLTVLLVSVFDKIDVFKAVRAVGLADGDHKLFAAAACVIDQIATARAEGATVHFGCSRLHIRKHQ